MVTCINPGWCQKHITWASVFVGVVPSRIRCSMRSVPLSWGVGYWNDEIPVPWKENNLLQAFSWGCGQFYQGQLLWIAPDECWTGTQPGLGVLPTHSATHCCGDCQHSIIRNRYPKVKQCLDHVFFMDGEANIDVLFCCDMHYPQSQPIAEKCCCTAEAEQHWSVLNVYHRLTDWDWELRPSRIMTPIVRGDWVTELTWHAS